jgi:hypothetical protein
VAETRREPLTATPGQAEHSPDVAPDGASVLFVRDDQVFALALATRQERRLTSGFRRRGAPRHLGSGDVLFPFTDDKQAGIERLRASSGAVETLVAGTARYAVVEPLGDGRHLVAEFLYDTGSPLADVLRLGSVGELRLLDLQGRFVGTLARSWRHGYGSPIVVPPRAGG